MHNTGELTADHAPSRVSMLNSKMISDTTRTGLLWTSLSNMIKLSTNNAAVFTRHCIVLLCFVRTIEPLTIVFVLGAFVEWELLAFTNRGSPAGIYPVHVSTFSTVENFAIFNVVL